jgi:ribosomal protein S18 acetylase RimI-like enzyme
MVREAILICGDKRQKAIRLDVLGSNTPAQKLYANMGFQYRDTIKLFYEDTGMTDYLLYEFTM